MQMIKALEVLSGGQNQASCQSLSSLYAKIG